MTESISVRGAVVGRSVLGPSVVSLDDQGMICSVEPTTGQVTDVLLVPGFVDLQVNGIDDVDVAHAAGGDWARLAELLLAQGTTAWCPTLVSGSLDRYPTRIARIERAMADGTDEAPTILGIHLEGPFLGAAPGAHDRAMIVPIDLAWLGNLPTSVRIVTIAAEIPGATAAAQLLSDRGIVVSIGHSRPSDAQADACIAAGATMVTHLFNGMGGIHHREDGLALVALDDDRVTAGLIADGVHVADRAIRLAVAAKGPDGIALVTDAVAWRRGSAGEINVALRDGAPRLADGTLAGSVLTMDSAIRHLVSRCRVPIAHAVTMASATPARVLGDPSRGLIQAGARADLVGLGPDLTVDAVWLAGRKVR